MSKTTIIIHSPVALYNCDKRELVGLFETKALAEKYLLLENKEKKSKGFVGHSIRVKGKIKGLTEYPVTARYCNGEQRKELGSKEYLIKNGYSNPIYNQMKGYDSTRIELYFRGNEISKNRTYGRGRQKLFNAG